MKRSIGLLMAIIMILSLMACSKPPSQHDHVTLTLPAEFMTEATDQDIEDMMDEDGIVDASRNEDGSVQVVLTKQAHENTLKDMKSGTDDVIRGLIEGENAVASFREITYNDDHTAFTVLADKSLYSEWDAFSVIGFYMSGAIYQLFAGVPVKDIDVTVRILDYQTEEELLSGSYRELKDAQ